MATRKKAPGENIEDWQRNTERLTLRLGPEAMKHLRNAAAEHGWTVAETVTEALAALQRELDAELEASLEEEAVDA